MKIDFNPDLFNNIYWHLLAAFNNTLLRFIWVYGGSSASKTFSVVQLCIVRMMQLEDENTLILRKYGVDIKDSIYQDFKNIISDWGLSEYFTVQVNFIRCNLTGSYVRFRGLDDSEKVKGIAGFKRVILEEISQFDEVDYKQIRKRLRGKRGQQIVGIFNPISEEHWIKKNVFDKEVLHPLSNMSVNVAGELQEAPVSGAWVNDKGNLVIFKTNYLDNKYIVGPNFVDQHTIDDFEHDKVHDNAYYQVYGLGNWGKLRTGGEFWKDFKYDRNTTGVYWNEYLPLFTSWDENVNPFLTCLVWQLYGPDSLARHDKKEIVVADEILAYLRQGLKVAVQIDEVCLEDPKNRVRDVCNEFIKRYPVLRVKGLFYGGDRTSVKEDTKLEKGENFYTKIAEYWRDYNPRLRLQNVNPSIVQSAGFINQCYAGGTDLVILINRRCTKSLNDYQYAVEDSDGTLKKTKKKHPVTQVTYEEYGHPSDAKRYMITTNFPNEYTLYLRGGKKLLPTAGKNISKNHF